MRIREPFACQGERPQKQPQGEQISVVYSFQLAIAGFSRLRKQTWETNTGLLLLVMLGMKPGPWVSEQARYHGATPQSVDQVLSLGDDASVSTQ